jgi:hypothetical protein
VEQRNKAIFDIWGLSARWVDLVVEIYGDCEGLPGLAVALLLLWLKLAWFSEWDRYYKFWLIDFRDRRLLPLQLHWKSETAYWGGIFVSASQHPDLIGPWDNPLALKVLGRVGSRLGSVALPRLWAQASQLWVSHCRQFFTFSDFFGAGLQRLKFKHAQA